MTSAGQTYYSSYVEETTKNNIQPIIAPRGKWVESLEGEEWTCPQGREALSPQWGDPMYGPVRVSVSNKGRVREVQSVMRGMSFVCAVHRTVGDYLNYKRTMPINTYLWG